MSDPIATPADLGTYLDIAGINTVRATQILALAQAKCERYVTPITVAALDVVLEVAGRAYTNVTNAQSQTEGPYSASGQSGGLYLTRANIRDLRLAAGRAGAFTIDMLPPGVTQVETLTVTATAGSYLLGLCGTATTAIAWNASLAALQAVLDAHPLIGAGNIVVTGTVGAYVLTFAGRYITTPVPIFTVDSTALTGTAVVAITAAGAYKPGQDMPWWDWSR